MRRSLTKRKPLAEYNERYAGVTLGIGSRDPLTGIWNPLLPVIADKH